jgi:uncharacterized protein (DUF1778 family)
MDRRSRLHPQKTLADRPIFRLDAVRWKAFLSALDAPPRPLPNLERLLKEPGFFDEQIESMKVPD